MEDQTKLSNLTTLRLHLVFPWVISPITLCCSIAVLTNGSLTFESDWDLWPDLELQAVLSPSSFVPSRAIVCSVALWYHCFSLEDTTVTEKLVFTGSEYEITRGFLAGGQSLGIIFSFFFPLCSAGSAFSFAASIKVSMSTISFWNKSDFLTAAPTSSLCFSLHCSSQGFFWLLWVNTAILCFFLPAKSLLVSETGLLVSWTSLTL